VTEYLDIVLGLSGAAAGMGFAWLAHRERVRAEDLELQASRAQREQRECEDRHRAEQAAAEALLASILENCGSGVIVLDGANAVVRTNDEAARLIGQPRGVIEGRPLMETALSGPLNDLCLLAAEQRNRARAEISRFGAGDHAVVASVSPVGSSPQRYLVVLQDVTELRRLETIRRDFVANVSHELRTPLASIRAMAETLQDGALQDPEVAHRFLNTIIDEAQRLTRISDDLLVLADAESRPPARPAFSLAGLVRAVVERLQSQATTAGLTLTAQTEEDLEAYAHPDQIEQVVLNLVDNAIKYTPAGGRVAVRAWRDNGACFVSVQDTGIGIMKQHQSRIFERFYRVDKARSRASGGTGLGLSIVKNIVEGYGGRVWVESEHNRGSTFTFSLPLPGHAAN
jgi:two-component system phosphate regulon sensor histidine kinase PhoR